ncbi:uncharacterized protein wu:fb74b10 [Clinocottus analis]|uniref:uncharacterized protein wu:fb74b10 n=1 Tax=Clinocottus analis TaxID=304258 RepID=UPI0035BF5A26
MTHFRGQIRGPHWGFTMDNMLIDFWRGHECLFNSSLDSYYDKDLKTKLWTEFATSIGKPVCDVERRSRSLRTQYGRVLWQPENVSTVQQKMLREKLDFLRPYIVRRRSDSYLEDKFDDRDEDEDELETEGSIDQEMGSSFGSPLDDDVTVHDPDDEHHPSSGLTSAPLHCLTPQPQVIEVMSLSCPYSRSDEGPADQPQASDHGILNQFSEVMLADMRQIKDPMVLMRLRRDVTDLVFKAVEEDAQRRCVRVPHALAESAPLHSCSRPREASSQMHHSWRQPSKRKNENSEVKRGKQRLEEMRHVRRMSRSPVLQSVQQGRAAEGKSGNHSLVFIQAAEIKKETE